MVQLLVQLQGLSKIGKIEVDSNQYQPHSIHTEYPLPRCEAITDRVSCQLSYNIETALYDEQLSVFSGHPHFFNQLFAGMDPFALGGAFITEALNCSA